MVEPGGQEAEGLDLLTWRCPKGPHHRRPSRRPSPVVVPGRARPARRRGRRLRALQPRFEDALLSPARPVSRTAQQLSRRQAARPGDRRRSRAAHLALLQATRSHRSPLHTAPHRLPAHARPLPTTTAHLRLAQQATLETRGAEGSRSSFDDMLTAWRHEAATVLGEEVVERITTGPPHNPVRATRSARWSGSEPTSSMPSLTRSPPHPGRRRQAGHPLERHRRDRTSAPQPPVRHPG